MAFQFEEDEAIEFGDREAVLIHNFRFWIRKNKANNHNFFDGRTWTWNKNDAFAKLFRFWTKDQVRRLIDSLVNQGVIIKGNYNSNPHDRTCWYAFADEVRFLREGSQIRDSIDLANLPNANGENAKSIWQNSKMDLAESINPIGNNANYITDNKPNIKTFLSLPAESKKEILKNIWKEKFLRSNFEKYFLFREKSNWSGVKNLEADIAWWENGYNEKNPVVSKKEIAEPASQTPLKQAIQSALHGNVNDSIYHVYFSDAEEGENVIYVTSKEALRYQSYLDKINVKIEVK